MRSEWHAQAAKAQVAVRCASGELRSVRTAARRRHAGIGSAQATQASGARSRLAAGGDAPRLLMRVDYKLAFAHFCSLFVVTDEYRGRYTRRAPRAIMRAATYAARTVRGWPLTWYHYLKDGVT